MNADVQKSNRKAELLANTVEHVAIDQYDARPVIDAMRKMSFTSRDTARAADIWSMSLEDAPMASMFGLAGRNIRLPREQQEDERKVVRLSRPKGRAGKSRRKR